jgi:outer membrane lipoprotein carrier protein
MIVKLLTMIVAFLSYLGILGNPTPAEEPVTDTAVAARPHKAKVAVAPSISKRAAAAPAQPAVSAAVTAPVSAGVIAPSWMGSARKTSVAARLSADEIVQKVQAFYRDTRQLTAKFRQTYTNKTFGKKSISDGKVWIKKPGKMRWDYRRGRKTRKSFISDGKVLWAVMHHQKQYFKQDLRDNMLPVAVSFLYGKGDLSRDFNAKLDTSKKYGGRDDLVVVLIPKKPSAQYKTLTLVVSRTDFRVKQSIVKESSGNLNHFRFYEPDTKREVKDTWFYFNEAAVKGKYRKVEPGKKKGKR